jgi:hypothetical protein
MTELDEEVKGMRVTRLKVALVQFVGKAGQGYRYLNGARRAFSWATDEEFNLATSDLVARGLLIETEGREGGVKLATVEQTKEATNG